MSISRRGLLAVSAALAATGTLSACSGERTSNNPSSSTSGGAAGALIGIAMPTKSLERWNRDGAYLVELLEKAGYKTSLQYADNKQDQQNNQVQNMLNDGAKVVVIASIDGTALGPVLDQAKTQGAKVIAYDRLINGSENVDYYATFDNYKVGQLQGQFILDNVDKFKGSDGKVNLEPFAGSPDDNNAKFFFSGAWDKIGEKVTSGEFVVPSGKAPKSNDEWQSIGIPEWKSTSAQSELENRLNSFYSGKKVNVVLSPNDSLALGIQQALDGAGYKVGTDWPLITGQDADLANVKAILEGKQAMTVWKDTRKLGEQVAKMVDQVVKGETVEVNDEKTYDNGKKVVPTFLVEPQVVVKDDVKTALVDSGFYKAEELGL